MGAFSFIKDSLMISLSKLKMIDCYVGDNASQRRHDYLSSILDIKFHKKFIREPSIAFILYYDDDCSAILNIPSYLKKQKRDLRNHSYYSEANYLQMIENLDLLGM